MFFVVIECQNSPMGNLLKKKKTIIRSWKMWQQPTMINSNFSCACVCRRSAWTGSQSLLGTGSVRVHITSCGSTVKLRMDMNTCLPTWEKSSTRRWHKSPIWTGLTLQGGRGEWNITYSDTFYLFFWVWLFSCRFMSTVCRCSRRCQKSWAMWRLTAGNRFMPVDTQRSHFSHTHTHTHTSRVSLKLFLF